MPMPKDILQTNLQSEDQTLHTTDTAPGATYIKHVPAYIHMHVTLMLSMKCLCLRAQTVTEGHSAALCSMLRYAHQKVCVCHACEERGTEIRTYYCIQLQYEMKQPQQ